MTCFLRANGAYAETMHSSDRLTVALAPDTFKGSLAAADAVAAMTAGVRQSLGDRARIIAVPLADGGEGTLDALLGGWAGTAERVETVDALGRPTTARFGLSADRRTAIIEAAEANGLPAVMDAPWAPLRADAYGVGLIARHALDAGVEQILLCIGGSASTDGGTGLLRGLGARFLGEDGTEVAPGGGGLGDIRRIDLTALHPRARAVSWRVAVDVDNPLTGPRGAAAVFGPQKGATPEDISVLERGLTHLAASLEDVPGGAPIVPSAPGLGAAGGIPLAAAVILGAELVPGSRLVSEALRLEELLSEADLVITGEGSFDSQSLDGKVVDLVRSTTPPGAPIIVIAGRVALSAQEVRAAGITAAFSLAPGPATLESLVENARERLTEVTAHAVAALTALPRTSPAGTLAAAQA